MTQYGFVDVRREIAITFPQDFIALLPQKVALFTTIQYIHLLDDMKKQLEDKGIIVYLIETKHTRHLGQILGCNIDKFQEAYDVDGYVYVGDGAFHPQALMYRNEKKVYCFEPEEEKQYIIDKEHITRLQNRHRASVSAFLMAKNVGVLIVNKNGQGQFHLALKIAEKYPDKNFYFFLDYNVDFAGLEDFPFIDVWVNSACPRIGYDDTNKITKPLVNIGDVYMTNLGYQEKFN